MLKLVSPYHQKDNQYQEKMYLYVVLQHIKVGSAIARIPSNHGTNYRYDLSSFTFPNDLTCQNILGFTQLNVMPSI